MLTRAEAPTVVLICHEAERLDRDGLASWLASTMKLAGLLIIRDGADRRWRAVRREMRRVGPWGLIDVVAFRALARVVHGRRDRELGGGRSWIGCASGIRPTSARYRQLTVSSPNSVEARAFVERVQPDLAIARCKVLLDRGRSTRSRERGTFVLHPGICPEYRNAHGCFWALANRDLRSRRDDAAARRRRHRHRPCLSARHLRLRRTPRFAHRHPAARRGREPRCDRTHAHRIGAWRGRAADQHGRTPVGRLGPAATDALPALEAGGTAHATADPDARSPIPDAPYEVQH